MIWIIKRHIPIFIRIAIHTKILINNYYYKIINSIFLLILLTSCSIPSSSSKPNHVNKFNSQSAYKYLEYQLSLGPRIPGSSAHEQLATWLYTETSKYGWTSEKWISTWQGNDITNVITRMGEGRPWILLGAHYDSRIYADKDPDPIMQFKPVPGANDGASGVAVLMELARVLPTIENRWTGQVWLVFFDAEDNGNIPGWDWALGSQLFVSQLQENYPDKVIIIDMVGDRDLKIYKEINSDKDLSRSIWKCAAQLGYKSSFLNKKKHSLIDDHTPFLRQNIPAVDIIDFDYPFWHTHEDTLDKVSAASLDIVGETLLAWLTEPADTDCGRK